MNRKIFVASIGTALLITGCHAFDNAQTGAVTGRQHVVQHQEYDYSICYAYGSNGRCTISVPIYKTVPECWRVDFHNAKDDEYGAQCVDEAEYQHYRLNSTYPRER